MKRNILIILSFCFVQFLYAQDIVSNSLQTLKKPSESKSTLVAVHRGDWRNAPENSIQALKNTIAMGAHIFELDVQLSKDSVLYLMHDKTIDRTTNKKGKVEDFTWEELSQMYLRNGQSRITSHRIPTLEEFLVVAKGKILINIDKGYKHLPLVVKMIQKYNMEDYIYISVDGGQTLEDVQKRYGNIPENIRLMPIINLDNVDYKIYIESFKPRKNVMFQPVFQKENEEAFRYIKNIQKQGYAIWYNSLWASLCAGHDDDRAVEQNQRNETWGWLIDKGANVIQTDRPIELLKYLN